jgi:archaemetzincin
MAFHPPTSDETIAAIGRTDGLLTAVQRTLTPDHDFEPIPLPQPGDWLAEHPERGQSFDDYVRLGAHRPATIRHTLYLQPFGRFEKDHGPSLEILREYAAAYFLMDVNVLPARQPSDTQLTTRINRYTQNRQVVTSDVLQLLEDTFPVDAFCVLAVTMEDLYPDPRWNFVFGQASPRDRVGVFSFARYHRGFYGKERGHGDQELLLRRSMKVLVHETAHMFSLAHCIYFKCVMNGSNHVQESDARPLSVCPVCLHKLQYSTGFDVAERYRRLYQLYRDVGFADEAEWVSRRLEKITM